MSYPSEPWFYRKHLFDPYRGDEFRRAMHKAWYLGGSKDDSDFIADVFLKDDGNDEAIMHRIVACVNAMKGVPDPEAFVVGVKLAIDNLETGGLSGGMSERECQFVHDALLSAYKQIEKGEPHA